MKTFEVVIEDGMKNVVYGNNKKGISEFFAKEHIFNNNGVIGTIKEIDLQEEKNVK